MNVRFQYVPLYFAQLLSHDQRYGSIEALINKDPLQPWYEVILTDKTTGRRIFYLNSLEAVNTLTQDGTIAYYSLIQFTALEKPDSSPTYQIALHDSYGHEITWRFVVNVQVTESDVRLTPPLGAPGFVVLHANRRFAAAPGTTVTIGRETVTAEVSDPDLAKKAVPYQAFSAKDLVMAEIAPGTGLWGIDSSPAEVREGEKWIFRSNGGQERILLIERAAGNQLQIRQVDQGNPFSPPAQLDVLRQDNALALRSISFLLQPHTLRISFQPPTLLPERQLEDRTEAAFVVAEDNEPIAEGTVSIQRALETEHIFWRFEYPNWARSYAFDSGVNLIPKRSFVRGGAIGLQ